MYVNTTPPADLAAVTLTVKGANAEVVAKPTRTTSASARHARLIVDGLRRHLDAVGAVPRMDYYDKDGDPATSAEASSVEEWATTTSAHVVRVQA